MKVIVDFIVDNRETIILIAACLLDLVLFLVGVFKKQKKEPSVFEYVMAYIPELLCRCEETFGCGHGEEKKAMALEVIKGILKKFGMSEDTAFLMKVDSYIEAILKTPTKKGN